MSNCQNHQECIDHAVQKAQAICKQQGTRFTASRQRVLKLVWAEHKPMKAYDLLNQLKKEDISAKPPTVYRALDFLLDQGLIHKIHRLNAYIGCNNPSQNHPCCFLICIQCNAVIENYDVKYHELLNSISITQEFQPDLSSLEIEGLCSQCNNS